MESKEMQKVENKDVVVARTENYDVGQEHYQEPVKTWDKGQDDFEKIIDNFKKTHEKDQKKVQFHN